MNPIFNGRGASTVDILIALGFGIVMAVGLFTLVAIIVM